MPNYFDPRYTAITSPLGSEEISPVRDLLNGIDKSITLTTLRTWVLSGLYRAVSGTTDTPTVTDDLKTIEFTGSSNQTVTLNHIGAGRGYTVWQTGTGVPQLVAGSGITLASPNTTPTYRPVARYGSLVVQCGADTTTVVVAGPMA